MTGRQPIHKAAAGTTIAILAIVVLAADQFTKHLALQDLTLGNPVKILGEALIFQLAFNPGGAFSLGSGSTWLFTIALGAVAIGILVLMFTRVRSRLWAVVLGALLGGVLGNLTDRLFRDPGFAIGHVVDFIYTPWMMPAIYNIADIFIVSSMISVALLVLFGLRLDGTREKDDKKDEAQEPEGARHNELVLGAFDEADRYESRKQQRERRAAGVRAADQGVRASLATTTDDQAVDAAGEAEPTPGDGPRA